MFIHDYYKKIAIEAIEKDLKNFNEDCLEDICYISMIISHRYDIDTKAFVALSKKYNLDFNTVIIDWNECFAHKLRIEKGVIINDEEIEDDDAIYFEFF